MLFERNGLKVVFAICRPYCQRLILAQTSHESAKPFHYIGLGILCQTCERGPIEGAVGIGGRNVKSGRDQNAMDGSQIADRSQNFSTPRGFSSAAVEEKGKV